MIRLIVLDVDGTLSDGSVIYSNEGVDRTAFNVKDGLRIAAWIKLGGEVAIIDLVLFYILPICTGICYCGRNRAWLLLTSLCLVFHSRVCHCLKALSISSCRVQH